MSLLTQAYLLEQYGPRLTIDQMAEVLGLKPCPTTTTERPPERPSFPDER